MQCMTLLQKKKNANRYNTDPHSSLINMVADYYNPNIPKESFDVMDNIKVQFKTPHR